MGSFEEMQQRVESRKLKDPKEHLELSIELRKEKEGISPFEKLKSRVDKRKELPGTAIHAEPYYKQFLREDPIIGPTMEGLEKASEGLKDIAPRLHKELGESLSLPGKVGRLGIELLTGLDPVKLFQAPVTNQEAMERIADPESYMKRRFGNTTAARELGFLLFGAALPPALSGAVKAGKFTGKQAGKVLGKVPFFQEMGERIAKNVRKNFYFAGALLKRPEFREQLRRVKDLAPHGYFEGHRVVNYITEGLNPTEYKDFRDIVVTLDLLETAGKGKKTPEIKKIATTYEKLLQKLTPNVHKSLQRHKEVTFELGMEKIRLGEMGIEVEDLSKWYFPHEVEPYLRIGKDLSMRRIGIPRNLRKQSIKSSKHRKGSEDPIVENYRDVMSTYVAESRIKRSLNNFLDNTLDGFDNLGKFKDLYSKLQDRTYKSTIEERALGTELKKLLGTTDKGKLKPPRDGKAYTIGGKEYMGFIPHYDKRTIYPANTVTEGNIQTYLDDVIGKVVEGKAIESSLNDIFTKVPAIGRNKEAFLLPADIYKAVTNMTPNTGEGVPFLAPLIDFGRSWKRLTLDLAGLPFQFANLFGDLMSMYRDNPAFLKNVPEAAKMSFPWDFPDFPKYLKNTFNEPGGYRHLPKKTVGVKSTIQTVNEKDEVIQEIVERNVPTGQRWLYDPKFIRALGASVVSKGRIVGELEGVGLKWADEYIFNNPVFRNIEKISEWRENIPRLATYLGYTDDIMHGKAVTNTLFPTKGLKPVDGVAKLSRELLIDYGAMGEGLAVTRNLLFPFQTFYLKNAKNWAKYASDKPAEASYKFMYPYMAMQYWNNSKFPEVEASLDDWMRFMPHIITGWKDKHDRHIIFSIQTPVDMAAKMFGVDGLMVRARQVTNGEKTLPQAVSEQVEDMVMNPLHMGEQLANPLIQGIIGGITGRDPITGHKVVDKKARYYDQLIDTSKYMLTKAFSPLHQYALMKYDTEQGKPSIFRSISPEAMVGGRRIDLAKQVGKRMGDESSRLQEHQASQRSRLHDIYIEVNGDTQNPKFKRFVKDSMFSNMTGKAFRKMVDSSGWDLEVFLKKDFIEAGKTPEAYDKYRKFLYSHKMSRLMKTMPKVIRGEFAKDPMMQEYYRIYIKEMKKFDR